MIDELGVRRTLEEHGTPEIGQCRIVGRRRTYEFDFPRSARGVSRMLLDDVLFRTAVARGAIALEGRSASALTGGRLTLDPCTILRPRRLGGALRAAGGALQQPLPRPL